MRNARYATAKCLERRLAKQTPCQDIQGLEDPPACHRDFIDSLATCPRDIHGVCTVWQVREYPILGANAVLCQFLKEYYCSGGWIGSRAPVQRICQVVRQFGVANRQRCLWIITSMAGPFCSHHFIDSPATCPRDIHGVCTVGILKAMHMLRQHASSRKNMGLAQPGMMPSEHLVYLLV